jgi:maltokinase
VNLTGAEIVSGLDPHAIIEQRWCRLTEIPRIELVDAWSMSSADPPAWWLIVACITSDGSAEYQVPVIAVTEPTGRTILGSVNIDGVDTLLVDGSSDVRVLNGLLTVGEPVDIQVFGDSLPVFEQVGPVGGDSTNTVLRADDHIVKIYRCLDEAGAREAHLLSALADAGTRGIPAVHALVSRKTGSGINEALAVVQSFVKGLDAWDRVTRILADGPCDIERDVAAMAVAVADIHACFARMGSEPWGGSHRHAMRDRVGRIVLSLRKRELPDDLASELLRVAGAIRILSVEPGSFVCAVHGDLHLGQLLHADTAYAILDFEGEPLATPEERMAWHSPLKDVAGMIRSFDYAAGFVRKHGAPGPDAKWDDWLNRTTAAFLDSYHSHSPVPRDDVLLSSYLLEKAVYELEYESRSRPGWISIPLRGLRRLLQAAETDAKSLP